MHIPSYLALYQQRWKPVLSPQSEALTMRAASRDHTQSHHSDIYTHAHASILKPLGNKAAAEVCTPAVPNAACHLSLPRSKINYTTYIGQTKNLDKYPIHSSVRNPAVCMAVEDVFGLITYIRSVHRTESGQLVPGQIRPDESLAALDQPMQELKCCWAGRSMPVCVRARFQLAHDQRKLSACVSTQIREDALSLSLRIDNCLERTLSKFHW
ncbi:hypothetical protein F4861DRAFT_369217 [Xylaria intraflava]|nr:hypothetical protein F4861DRAFT_369217 [Xylaria intraflava]